MNNEYLFLQKICLILLGMGIGMILSAFATPPSWLALLDGLFAAFAGGMLYHKYQADAAETRKAHGAKSEVKP